MAHIVGKAARLGAMAARSTHVNTLVPKRNYTLPMNIRNWMYNLSGFNQYGLYKDDLLIETDEVVEALRRLSPQLQDERAFRIQRASQLQLMHTVLPKDQWPTYEEDLEKGRYLQNLLEEVKKENSEKAMWARR